LSVDFRDDFWSCLVSNELALRAAWRRLKPSESAQASEHSDFPRCSRKPAKFRARTEYSFASNSTLPVPISGDTRLPRHPSLSIAYERIRAHPKFSAVLSVLIADSSPLNIPQDPMKIPTPEIWFVTGSQHLYGPGPLNK
jgi:hypothetical protein